MLSYTILTHVESKKWNSDLTKSNCSTFFQTAEYLLPEKNKTPLFLYVHEDNEVKAQLGIIIRDTVKGRSGNLFGKTTEIASKVGSRGTWVGGPIIHSEDKIERLKIIQVILEALEKISNDYNLMILDGYTPAQDLSINDDFLNTFQKHKFKIENFVTLMTELKNFSIEELWKNVKKNARNDVTKAKRLGVTVKEIKTKKELEDFKILTKKWAKTKGIEISNPLETLDKDWQCLDSESQKFFLAFKDENVVAGLRIGCFNNIAYTHQVLNSYSESGLTAGPLLTWHALEWAKNNNLKIYDFSGGLAPSLDQNKEKYLKQWDSLFKYKKKWGGTESPYYHMILVKNKTKFKFFRLLSKPDWIYRDFKKKRYERPKKN